MPWCVRYLLLATAPLACVAVLDAIAKFYEPTSAIGLKLLLYWPFPLALPLLVVGLFSVLGWRESQEKQENPILYTLFGTTLGLVWCAAAFVIILNLHLELGG